MPMTLTRSILGVLIPGLVAITPWLLLLVQTTSATLGYDKYVVLANALVFSFAAVVGTVLESIGSGFEASWDREREQAFSVRENWYAYLARSFDNEPVGYRYLSRLVTTLYFELSMMMAAPLFCAGAGFLALSRFVDWMLIIVLAMLVSVIS